MNRPKRIYDGWGESGGAVAWVGRSFVGAEYEIALAAHMGGADYRAAVAVEEDGRVTWEKIAAGVEVPTLLRLRPDELEALLKATTDVQPPSTSMQRHLEDAITVRDRLLTLVETEARP